VLEAAAEPRWKPGEALSPESNAILDQLGLTEALAERSDLAIRSAGVRSAWGSHEAVFRDGFREPHGAGWIIDRLAFETLLYERAVGAGAVWVWGARVTSAVCDLKGYRLGSSNRSLSPVEAQVVIDATGRPASIARRLGARRRPMLPQIATVAFWPTPQTDARPWLSVESGPDGWWYTTRGPGGLQILAWLRERPRDDVTVERVDSRIHEAFAATSLMREAVALPPRRKVGLATVDAGYSTLGHVCGDGWLAVGDAAVSFDPISSHGLPNALASGRAAAYAVQRWLQVDRGALEDFAATMAATCDHHRVGLIAHYRSERRWPERPFWRRRHGLV
jgi:flavin-dependent dehydrogenase